MKKKSQITIFIILGMVILMAAIGYIFFTTGRVKIGIMHDEQSEELPGITEDVVTKAIDACLYDISQKSIGDFGLCNKEEKISTEVYLNLSSCMNLGLFKSQGYIIEGDKDPEMVNVTITDDILRIYVKYHLVFTRGNASFKIDEREFILPMEKTLFLDLDGEGRLTRDQVLVSQDNMMELQIPKGTKVTASGSKADRISVALKPICPDDSGTLSRVHYAFIPGNIRFSPEAYLTVKYRPDDVSPHAKQEKFKLAYLDQNIWKTVESSTDFEKSGVTATVDSLPEWVASCLDTNKFGMQSMTQMALAYPNKVDRDKIRDENLLCTSSFTGPCGFSKQITFSQPGQPYYLDYYYEMANKTYDSKLIPFMTLKEMAPPKGIWFHAGYCNGKPTYCSDEVLSKNPECSGYSLDCLFGEDEDGKNKPVYDYTLSIKKTIELINKVHSDKPQWPLYLEIWNEPNLGYEWGNISLTDYEISEFSRYFIELARSIKELPHSGSIKVITPGLAPTTGEKRCELKPSMQKKYYPSQGKSVEPNFILDDCAKLSLSYMKSGNNLCTGEVLPTYQDTCQDPACTIIPTTPPQTICSPTQETHDKCVCNQKSSYVNSIKKWFNDYTVPSLGLSHVFSDLSFPSPADCPTSDDMGNADKVRQRIIDTFMKYCYLKTTAVDTNEYIDKLLYKPDCKCVNRDFCKYMDLWGDHPYPSADAISTFPGGSDPFGMEAYKNRYAKVAKYCAQAGEISCTPKDAKDTDGDGIIDLKDNCPNAANPEQEDIDRDGKGDACDDSDNDNVLDKDDKCPYDQKITQGADKDTDGIADTCDNCPNVKNRDQIDLNVNKIGDACESDIDNDGILNTGFEKSCAKGNKLNCNDNCPYTVNPDQKDTDGDGIGETCDNCETISNIGQSDWNHDNLGDACEDTDLDGYPDNIDFCPNVASKENTITPCNPVDLCPGKIFITETAYYPVGETSNVDNYIDQMACSLDMWENDSLVVGENIFHQGDDRLVGNDFKDMGWTAGFSEDGCTGKQIYQKLATGKYHPDCRPPETELPEGGNINLCGNLKIVLYGDSITEEHGNLGNSLQQVLGSSATVIIKGYHGEEAFSPNRNIDTEILSENPNMVILWWGMNSGGDIDSHINKGIKPMIDKLLAKNIVPIILTTLPVCSKPYIDTRDNKQLCSGLGYGADNTLLSYKYHEPQTAADKALAAQYPGRVFVIDDRAMLQDKIKEAGCCTQFYKTGTIDGVHPNADTHQMIAGMIAKQIKDWQESNTGPFKCN